MNKKLIIVSAVALGTVGALSATRQSAYAEETQSKYPPIIQKLVDKFKLNESEVNKVVEEARTERQAQRRDLQAERQKIIEEKLAQAVKDGKITEDQKTKILNKINEMRTAQQNERQEFNMRNLSQEERKAEMEKRRDEMEKKRAEFETWQKELGVDVHELVGMGPFSEGGFGRQGKRGW